MPLLLRHACRTHRRDRWIRTRGIGERPGDHPSNTDARLRFWNEPDGHWSVPRARVTLDDVKKRLNGSGEPEGLALESLVNDD